jgi:hypothetical protein
MMHRVDVVASLKVARFNRGFAAAFDDFVVVGAAQRCVTLEVGCDGLIAAAAAVPWDERGSRHSMAKSLSCWRRKRIK